MKQPNTACKRLVYLVLFLVLVSVEVLIAFFVHDSFVRPYVGDVIVVAVICCFLRIFMPNKIKLMPLYVFLFATAVEALQYFNYVTLLGLGDSKFFRILLGTSFSYADIICYAVGGVICFGAEYIINYASANICDQVIDAA